MRRGWVGGIGGALLANTERAINAVSSVWEWCVSVRVCVRVCVFVCVYTNTCTIFGIHMRELLIVC